MKLKEIKDQVASQLSKLTIDDFYAKPALIFVKEAFSKITKLKKDDEIEKYLSDKFSETTVEQFRYSLESNIKQMNGQIEIVKKDIEGFRNEITNLEKQIAEKNEKRNALPKEEAIIKSDLKEIEAEIKQIKPLANKAPYDVQMENLEKTKSKKSKSLEENAQKDKTLKSEIETLHSQINSAKENITQRESEIKKSQKDIAAAKQSLNELKTKENTHFRDEYSSLEFLFKLLLNKQISKQEVEELIDEKTGETWDEYWKRVDKTWLNQAAERNRFKPMKRGKMELHKHGCSLGDVLELASSFTRHDAVIPKGWREILYQILSKPLPNLVGTFVNPYMDDDLYLNREVLKLTQTDLSTMIALKIALNTKSFVKTADNDVILYLSGGITAVITFREKGNIISEFQKEQLEIFAVGTKDHRVVKLTLYPYMSVAVPSGYYILTEKFVIKISFAAAPILFDNSSLPKFATTSAGIAELEQEIYNEEQRKLKEEREAEEERRRRYDDDDD